MRLVSPPRRLLRLWPVAVIALVLVVHALFWTNGAGAMRRSVEKWEAAQRETGLDVRFGRVETTGYPFVWRGVVHGADIAAPSLFHWSAEKLRIRASPFAPKRLEFSTDSAQTIDLGRRGLWRIDSDNGLIRVTGGKAWSLEILSDKSLIERADGGAAVSSEKSRFIVAPARSATGGVEAELAVEGLFVSGVADDGVSRSFGAHIIEARLALVPASEEAPQSLEIRRFHAEAAGAKVELSGALLIDALGYPDGALNAEIANPGAIAMLLGEIGALSPADAEQAAASLTLAALAGGGKITAPLVLKDGYATIAGVRIARLPRLLEENYAPSP